MVKVNLTLAYLPVVICVLTVFGLSWLRPSFMIKPSNDTTCPYCINPWIISLIVLITGTVAFYFSMPGKYIT